MSQKNLPVQKIARGLPYKQALKLSGSHPALSQLNAQTTRLVAQFRSIIAQDPPLAIADTLDGTLAITAPDTLEFRLTAAQTATFTDDYVHTDIVRIDAGVQERLPFTLKIPVMVPITRNVT